MKLRHFLLLVFAILVSCSDPESAPNGNTPTSSSSEQPHSEETWLVGRIASAVTGQELTAESEEVGNNEPPRYRIRDDEGTVAEITIKTYLWDPAMWASLAKGESSGEDLIEIEGLLGGLLDPNAATMRELDGVILAALRENPASAEAHDSAALLLTVFGLRENACDFNDYRGALSDACAMLARSFAIRGGEPPQGSTGELALIALEVLCGRYHDAKKRIKTRWSDEPTGDPVERSWFAVLNARNENDFRFIDWESAETLMEQSEFIRAYCYRVGSGRALEKLFERLGDLEVYPDLTRPFFHLDFHSSQTVGAGHVLKDLQIPFEFAEAARAFGIEVSDDPDADFPFEAVARELTRPCDPLAGMSDEALIPEDRWRAWSQRHLLGFSLENLEFIRDSWGNAPAAREWMNQFGGVFQQFSLFPLAELKWVESQERFDEALEGAAKWMNGDLAAAVPAGAWTLPTNEWQDFRSSGKLRRDSDWFRKAMPEGTVINFLSRCVLKSPPRSWRTKVAAQFELAPSIPYLTYEHAENNMPTEEGIIEVYGDKLEIDTNGLGWALKRAQKRGSTETVLRYMEMKTEIDPGEGLDLGRLLVALGEADEAAEAYLRAWKEGSDDVSAANSLNWLMHHLYGSGDKAGAREVAEFCAEVFSFRGLETMCDFQRMEGDVPGAVETALSVKERYGSFDPIWKLCHLLPDSPETAAYRAGFQKAVSDAFPNGIETVALSDFPAGEAPDGGVRHEGSSLFYEVSPLGWNDVVVALEGIRVRSKDQYLFVNDLGATQVLDVIVWNSSDGYREFSFEVAGRLFGTALHTEAGKR